MKTNVIPIHNGALLMPLQYQQAASQLRSFAAYAGCRRRHGQPQRQRAHTS